ncbi:hypothetical protein [Pedobacter sp. GR22-6]|uniref:hypothetical protein n=1 Tax=Pedobacter sp. GR22-6 TaxID=3127957 RepID=UPI00307FB06C
MKQIIGLILGFVLTGLSLSAQSTFDKKILEAVKQLKCAEPSDEAPVRLNAGLVAERDSVAVVVKVQLAVGWHIYQYVPASMPYIAMDHILKIPEGLKAAGNWVISPPFPSAQDKGVLIYEKQAWFIHKMLRTAGLKKDAVVKAGLYYQTCDLRQCLQPVEEVFDLKIADIL